MGSGLTTLLTQKLDLRNEGIDYRLLQQHFLVSVTIYCTCQSLHYLIFSVLQIIGVWNLARLEKIFLCNNKLSV